MSDKLAIKGQNSALRLQVNWRESFKASAKLLVDFYFKNQNNIGIDAADLLASLGFGQKITPQSLAGLLINRALIQAMAGIISTYCEEWKQLTPAEREGLNEHLLSQIPIEGSNIEIDRENLDRPETFGGLAEAQAWMELWLQDLVASAADVRAMSARLPSYFTCALHELRENRDKYQPLTNHFADTLVSEAYQREMGWRRYTAWLDKQLDEPIFAETFGIRPLYVPLCAYYIDRQEDRQESSQTRETRHARDLESAMDEWLADDKAPRLRLISGGPGSGKSTFTKWWAARVAAQGNFKVWHIALNHLNFTGDLEGKLQDFATKNPYLKGNPLDEPKTLIIFDGLDELALSGKVGLTAAENFTEQICTLVQANSQHLKVLISGRDAIVHSQINKFSKPEQIWHLLPYYLSENTAKQYQAEPQDLLKKDRRHTWWQQYGRLKGKKCEGLPQNLRINSLDEITSQPILNYLVAISDYFLQNKINEKTTRNQIYQSLLQKVYERGWTDRNKATGNLGHPITQSISFTDFQLILEEVGLCAWHGDGRTVTEAAIVNHCNSTKEVQHLLSYFSESLKSSGQARITKLFTAFHFQARGTSDSTFEFTHKSFGEFLTAKRLVRAMEEINEEYRKVRRGWTEKVSLKHWSEVCKSGTLDFDILEFVRQEVRLIYRERPAIIEQWQETCCKLIEYLLREGLPMEEFGGLSFYQMNNRAIQSEIMLLALLNACAICTEKLSIINWIDNRTFGTWLARMQGQKDFSDRSIAALCLSWLNLDGAMLVGARLDVASLDGASLNGARLNSAILVGSRLDGVNLDGASLVGARLDVASLDGASLNGASLSGAHLDWAHLLDISWDKHTNWANVQGIETAKNVPEKLKHLGLN
jgi:Pentapeptide repeats (8 copies)